MRGVMVGKEWRRKDYTKRNAVVSRVEPKKVYVTYPDAPHRAPERFGVVAFHRLFEEVESG